MNASWLQRIARWQGVSTAALVVSGLLAVSAPVCAQGVHAAHASLFDPRESSGTAWVPGVTPMSGVHAMAGAWSLMVHGDLFVQFLYESGDEHHGSHQAGSINWLMAAARRPIGNGRVGVRAMASLEPWTVPRCGYSDLLATGELCDAESIHDRQHPHDLVMELAAEYDRPLAGAVRWQIYAGVAGEPALGPPAYPHRPSAFRNPIAPIAHHWFDSTHIAFGVVTTGVYGARWKAEGSIFNGREPDEVRTDLDLAPLDSVAGRISLAPTERMVLQLSAGHLREAEAGVGRLPRHDANRMTASALHHRPVRDDGQWATTAAYGVKWGPGHIPGAVIEQTTHAALVETSVTLDGRTTWFGRFELVGKPAHDFHAEEFVPRIFTVGKLQLGYVRQLGEWRQYLTTSVGASVSTSFVPELLAPRYAGRVAPGFGVFLLVEPGARAR